ncbi:MAG TPA: hypothetical protein VJ962_01960 [Clostridia bacterium]|nr:hypothetical protein [Clostridia bacterium]
MKRYDVRIAVWLAVAIMTYEKYHEVVKRRKPEISDFYFRQANILPRAEAIAIGKVHSPRISQWYNGDHENSNYNYLKAEGPLRRLTQKGEFAGKKELPMNMRLNNYVETEVGDLTIGELIEWVKTTYSAIESDYNKTKEDMVSSEENKSSQVMKQSKIKNDESMNNNEINHDKKREILPLEKHIEDFAKLIKSTSLDIYNAFSLKHELGNYLSEKLPRNYKIHFDRSFSDFGVNAGETINNKMDLVIFNSNKNFKYCVAIKFPINNQIPLTMYKIIKDFKLLEQLMDHDFIKCYQITLIDDEEFLTGVSKEGIYEYFRTDTPIHGEILNPTGRNDEKINIKGHYQMYWRNLGDSRKLSIVEVH